MLQAEDVEELIILALREGAPTAGERRNVHRIKQEYIATRRAMAEEEAAAKKQAQEAGKEASKEKGFTPRVPDDKAEASPNGAAEVNGMEANGADKAQKKTASAIATAENGELHNTPDP